jgi:phage tail sheath protein FI
MPSTKQYRTPGVYVAELSSFPPSVVGVDTAVPVFIGYTKIAEVSGKPMLFKPIRVTSLADFELFFGGADAPFYSLEPGTDTPDGYDLRVTDPHAGVKFYRLQSHRPSFNLYNSMQLFYANGGGNCYVVSCGLYAEVTDHADINLLTRALAAAGEQTGPTMVVIPDALLLPHDSKDGDKNIMPWHSTEYATLAKAMLRQCNALKDRVAVLDVYGTQYLTQPPADAHTDRPTLDTLIARFREDVGTEFLSFGMAYFPFLQTSVVPAAGVTYASISNAPVDATTHKGRLQELLSWQNFTLNGDPSIHENTRAADVQKFIDAIPHGSEADKVAGLPDVTLNANLTAALPLLTDMQRVVLAKESVLPPSAAMAGVMTSVDANRGVWNAPANVGLAAVVRPIWALNNDQQGDLNLPVNGKAVDALREFPGRGTVVWGARTLDGNSNDFRYIQVRRTMIYIEQSIKAALNPFVFAPNNGQTWTTAVSMVSTFLQTLWSRGGLMGATPSEAFSVQCGLGSTMTAQDVLDGYMIVQVVLQLIRPAEFIELTFRQQMAAA